MISSTRKIYLLLIEVTSSYIQHNETVVAMAKAQGLSPVEGMKTFFKDFFVAFPDYNVSIEYIGAEDDKVFAVLNWKGTHKKPFMGQPATGKTIHVRTAEVMRIENGKFAGHLKSPLVFQNKNLKQLLSSGLILLMRVLMWKTPILKS
jgi:steroid delta-isomerase-like uncharacterized protein